MTSSWSLVVMRMASPLSSIVMKMASLFSIGFAVVPNRLSRCPLFSFGFCYISLGLVIVLLHFISFLLCLSTHSQTTSAISNELTPVL